ncbi:MAG: aspartate aminotransferase family protein [Candidatus Omnitrophica bacterium]|nr:aspartate aminotransferase family protein [Candidatus Omnitrophota bacterium]MDE2223632.1 aspartate aminotransferase family protein [Candidatus Omnitrophota bacterium]
MEQLFSKITKADTYATYVNPQWVKLMDLLEMNVQYEHCTGAELLTKDGRRILDFLSCNCVMNMGHNHPAIIQAVKSELDLRGPTMLPNHVPPMAGLVAEKLCHQAGGKLHRVYFCSSGSEGIESVIKFARAHTKRSGIIHAQGSFHGLTCGALSLMDNHFWKGSFGPFLPDVSTVSFNDLEALETKLAARTAAAFIVEPIQAEAGVRLPQENYLREAQRLCERYGTLFVLDEVQTGMWRCGPFLAAQHYGVEPDMVVLAKALSGGLVPIGAVLMSEKISNSVFGSIERCMIHTSTFSENALGLRAAAASLDVLERERLGEKGRIQGEKLRHKLSGALTGFEMVKEIRGLGMMTGIEFQAPRRFGIKVSFETFKAIHPGMFGQVLVMRLFADHGIIAQICGNNFMVLKITPPLIITDEQIDHFVTSIKTVLRQMHDSDISWADAVGIARRALLSKMF